MFPPGSTTWTSAGSASTSTPRTLDSRSWTRISCPSFPKTMSVVSCVETWAMRWRSFHCLCFRASSWLNMRSWPPQLDMTVTTLMALILMRRLNSYYLVKGEGLGQGIWLDCKGGGGTKPLITDDNDHCSYVLQQDYTLIKVSLPWNFLLGPDWHIRV